MGVDGWMHVIHTHLAWDVHMGVDGWMHGMCVWGWMDGMHGNGWGLMCPSTWMEEEDDGGIHHTCVSEWVTFAIHTFIHIHKHIHTCLPTYKHTL